MYAREEVRCNLLLFDDNPMTALSHVVIPTGRLQTVQKCLSVCTTIVCMKLYAAPACLPIQSITSYSGHCAVLTTSSENKAVYRLNYNTVNVL